MNTPDRDIIDFNDYENEVRLRRMGIVKGLTKPAKDRAFQNGQRFKIGKMGDQESAFQNYTFIISDCEQSGEQWLITAVLDQQQ